MSRTWWARTKSLQERMDEYTIPVTESGCHIWIASLTSSRYGQIMVDKKAWTAHRLAWTLANGPIPDGGWILHKCDTPQCVNPEHLFLGSPSENTRDMLMKKRGKRLRGRFVRPNS